MRRMSRGELAWPVQHSGGFGKMFREKSVSIATMHDETLLGPPWQCQCCCMTKNGSLRKEDERRLLVVEIHDLAEDNQR